ncbi:hypothetical protein CR513_46292, partial [Mucuna pruriens]
GSTGVHSQLDFPWLCIGYARSCSMTYCQNLRTRSFYWMAREVILRKIVALDQYYLLRVFLSFSINPLKPVMFLSFRLKVEEIRQNLFCYGFCKSYTTWTWYGELLDIPNLKVDSISAQKEHLSPKGASWPSRSREHPSPSQL